MQISAKSLSSRRENRVACEEESANESVEDCDHDIVGVVSDRDDVEESGLYPTAAHRVPVCCFRDHHRVHHRHPLDHQIDAWVLEL